jgi:hypothetical protein
MTPLVSDAALDVLIANETPGSPLADLACEIKRLQLVEAGCAPVPGQVRRAARELARRLARVTAERDAARHDLQRVIGSCAHVRMGTTPDEVCDRVVRAHDEIVALRDERDALRAVATAARPVSEGVVADTPALHALAAALAQLEG